MTLDDLLVTLKERNIALNVENGKLRYRGPEQALTPEVIGELRQRKDELIAREAKSPASSNGPTAVTKPAAPRRRRQEAVKLAPSQESFWLLHRMDPANISNNISIGWSLRGELNRAALQAACDGLISRHEALRLRIVERDSEGWLEVQEPSTAVVEFHSLREIETEKQPLEQDRLCTDFICRPYDFSRAPLFRFLLLELDTDRHVMVWGAHHIIGDGTSWNVLQNDFEALYDAYQKNEPANLPDVAVHLSDFAEWQRSRLLESDQQELKRHWKSVLPADLAPLELPTDYPRPALQSFDGGTLPISLPSDLVDAIRTRAREQSCTLNMVVMACLKTVFHRVSGQEDIVVGVPLSLRDAPELANVVGPLLNTVPACTNFSGDPTFNELLKRERNTLLDVLGNHELPFLQILQSVQPVRDASRNPLFQVMCETLPEREFLIPGLVATEILLEGKGSQVDLTMHLRECEDGIGGFVEYSTALFEPETIERFLGHFQTVIEAVAEQPDLRISEIPLLSDAQQREMLIDWNATEAEFAKEKGFHHLFEEQVARNPSAPALVFDGRELSYEELNTRSNKLANHLRSLGIGPDKLVGLYVERSMDLVIGALGILKAGGAYVPMDPTYPKQRLAFMLEDTEAKVILTQSDLIDELPPHQAELLCLDADWGEIDSHSSEAPLDVSFRSDQLAYVIFTSGSTGRPKGVMVEHRNASNFINGMDNAMHPGRSLESLCRNPGVWLAVTSLSFDPSVLDLFWSLSRGFKVVLYSAQLDQEQKEGQSIPALVAAHSVTHMQCVPTMVRMLLSEAEGVEALRAVDKLLIGGEALTGQMAADLQAHMSGEVINVYGPTETTVWCSAYTVQSAHEMVPIGKPIANVKFYVLDAYGQPAPVGVPGELYIGGEGVTRGYIGRPDLTEERFVANSFDSSGSRLYRTGDRVAYQSDGNLAYLGRVDFQVKIRGHRIELGEIETAIVQSATVPVHTVVTTWSPEASDVRLVAYIETEDAGDLQIDSLREKLRDRLSDYMVPQHFVIMEEFPKTASGKVDRGQLPIPNEVTTDRELVPARTPKEQLLFKAWREVLSMNDVSRTDNFFDVGGHSLLAMELIGRIDKDFGAEVTFRTLMRSTLGDIAEQLADDAPERAYAGLIPSMPRDEAGVELALSQEPLWLLHQMDPENISDHLQVAWKIEGELDRDALQGAFDALVRRHESLRLSIKSYADRGRVQINKPFAADLNFQTLCSVTSDNRLAEQQRICVDVVNEPFDFSCAPLFRIKLIELAPNRHFLLWVIHHIIVDGVSIGVLRGELAKHYEALVKTNKPAQLPELRVQYTDFAIWQRSRLTADRLDELQNYWKAALPANLPPLELPTDHPRPSLQTFSGSSVSIELPKDITDAMRARSREESCSLIVTMMTCLKTLLHRISGQEEVVVGVPVALRDNTDLTNMVGLLLNTLPVRTSFSENDTFREVLHREQDTFLTTLDHKDLSFNQIVKAVQPVRDPSRNPLFQVMFEMMPGSEMSIAGLKTDSVMPQNSGSQFDLGFYLWEYPDGLKGFIQYNTALFKSETIERLLGHFRTVIEAVAEQPDLRISEIPLLSDAERREMLADWNATEAPFAEDKGIHHLFEEQVARNPSAPALVFDGRELSYEELNMRSNQLANHLRSLGVGPDDLVGLHVERSTDLVIGALGILKAGGAYVPMDPAYPNHRLALMLEDSEAKVVLTQSHLVDELPPHQAEVVCLDTDWEALARRSGDALTDASFNSDQLAYVIFTSGSTGRPKGVMVEHHNASNFFTAMDGVLHPNHESPGVWLAVTSLSFDISVLELFWTLSRGFKVVLYSNELDQERDAGQSIPALVAAHDVTHMQCVPAMARHLLSDTEGAKALSALRTMLIGGEAFPGGLAADLRKHVAGDVINMYGPTETTVWSSTYPADGDADIVPIGKPVANTELYVLDSYGRPAPVGVPGELYIGGAGVTRGYLGRPDLTEERFVANPFDTSGGRLYRTGDRVAYRADGVLKYLGRTDFQVKIRGYRIELGEIEAAVAQSMDARVQVVVATWCPEPTDVRLVAYIETDDTDAPKLDELREGLRGRLPDYMVPQHFVVLKEFPKTANGKIDRNQLPAPSEIKVNREIVSAQTSKEELLFKTWGAVLGTQDVSRTDNFFDVGGHSLLAMGLIGRIHREFGVEVSFRSLLRGTLGDVAELLVDDASKQKFQALIPQVPRDGKNGTALALPQEPLWIVHQMDPENISYNMWMGWEIEGALDRVALQGAFDALVRRHESLRLRIEPDDGQGRLYVEEPISVTVDFQSLSDIDPDKRNAEQDRLGKSFLNTPFDFSRAPLFRIKLLQLETDRHALIWVIHHIVGDGISMDVLQTELAQNYEALRKTGEPAQLPDLRVQYSDFAAWQRARLTADRLDELQNYWKTTLPADLPPLELPTDRARPAVQTFDGQPAAFNLSKDVTDALRMRSREQGCSLVVMLMTCVKTLLHRVSGQADVVVGVPVALRDNADLTDMVGLMLNVLPVRTSFAKDSTFREVLRQEQNTFLETLDHRDLPFHQIVQAVQPARDPSRNPLFQVMFEMMPSSEMSIPELKVSQAWQQSDGAQFDLAFYLWDSPSGISGYLQYSTALFEPETIERFLGHFQTVIEAVAEQPDLRISEIPLLSDAQQREMLIDWNATEAEFAKEKGFHHLFEEQVARNPSAPALVFDGRELSYEELNTRSNKLANHLRSLGIGPDKLVGLYVERSMDLVIGALGILKAGGAYVPMDPTYPKQRLAFMLEDTEAKVILTQSDLIDELPPHQAELLCLDADWGEIDSHSSEAPLDVSFRSDQLAYVIFTSGSTGRPKGVMVEHRNASNFINGMDNAMHPGRSLESLCRNPGVWLAVTSLSFDPSVLDLFWSLSRGFKVVLYSAQLDQEQKEGQSIPALVAAHSVTHMQCVPTMVRMLLSEAEGVEALRAVDKLLIGGEALTGQMAADLQAHMSGEVINVYGPTETTVWCSAYTVQSAHEMVPIGKPIANVKFYVLDAYGQPAPVGVPGELYIGGEGVTRGYIGRPDLTEERFVANSFDSSGSRLYRTGDRVAYQSDGNLAYLGRVDFQVKIRGHRIELGEIETAIVQSATVPVHTVVTTWSPEASDVRLVAYIETGDAGDLQIDSLREKLRDRLSNYMVPQHFVVMEKFPKTASGKVDRSQLPSPKIEGAASRSQPLSVVEQKMISLWQNSLHVQSIGPSDNFFDLGGHSLSAVQLAADISRAFKVPFSPRHLMQEPELHALSKYVEQLMSGQSQADGKSAIDTNQHVTRIDSDQPDQRQPIATDGGIATPTKRSRENRWRGIKNRLLQIIALYAPGSQTWRVRLHRARGVTIGQKVTIGTSALLETSSPHLIEIGSKVQIGIRAVFIAHMGDMTPDELKTKPTIRVEDNVYIGPGVIILPNVTIGRGSVVAAGSVVNRSIPPETVVQGNPAEPVARCPSPLAWNSYQDFSLNLEPLENGTNDADQRKSANLYSIDGGLGKKMVEKQRSS